MEVNHFFFVLAYGNGDGGRREGRTLSRRRLNEGTEGANTTSGGNRFHIGAVAKEKNDFRRRVFARLMNTFLPWPRRSRLAGEKWRPSAPLRNSLKV